MTIIGVLAVCLGITSPCSGDTSTSGGTQVGVPVYQEFTIHQGAFDTGANDLHFKVWQKEDNIDIEGWEIRISHFTQASSTNAPVNGYGDTSRNSPMREGLQRA